LKGTIKSQSTWTGSCYNLIAAAISFIASKIINCYLFILKGTIIFNHGITFIKVTNCILYILMQKEQTCMILLHIMGMFFQLWYICRSVGYISFILAKCSPRLPYLVSHRGISVYASGLACGSHFYKFAKECIITNVTGM